MTTLDLMMLAALLVGCVGLTVWRVQRLEAGQREAFACLHALLADLQADLCCVKDQTRPAEPMPEGADDTQRAVSARLIQLDAQIQRGRQLLRQRLKARGVKFPKAHQKPKP